MLFIVLASVKSRPFTDMVMSIRAECIGFQGRTSHGRKSVGSGERIERSMKKPSSPQKIGCNILHWATTEK